MPRRGAPPAAGSGSLIRLSSPAAFLLALVCFLFPFVTVSCPMSAVHFSGLQLATGTTVQQTPSIFGAPQPGKRIDPDPFILLAIAAGFLGLAATVRYAGSMLGIAGGVAAAASLFVFKVRTDAALAKEGGGLIRLEYETAFLVAIGAFAGAVLAAVLARRDAPPAPAPAEAASGPTNWRPWLIAGGVVAVLAAIVFVAQVVTVVRRQARQGKEPPVDYEAYKDFVKSRSATPASRQPSTPAARAPGPGAAISPTGTNLFPPDAPELQEASIGDGSSWEGRLKGVSVNFSWLTPGAGTLPDGGNLTHLGAFVDYGESSISADGRSMVSCQCDLTLQSFHAGTYRFTQRWAHRDTMQSLPEVPDCFDGDLVTFKREAPDRARMTWTTRDGVRRGEATLQSQPWRD